ncbi:MAG TPA: MBL fold metallo-hydrolase [Actinomycetota bacterium]
MSLQRILEGYTTGVFASNTFVLAARAGEGAVVIDPGQDADELIAERLAAHGLTLEAVLLTHGHVDHVWTAAAVAEAAGAPVFLHPEDRYLLDRPGAAIGLGADFELRTPEQVEDLHDEQRLSFGGVGIEVRHTPGHTPGHCVFLTDGILISGDLIFQGSVGRTDFPRGSFDDLMDSIRRVVLPLEDEIVILPGHGAETTVGIERRTNPFVVADASGDLPKLLGL